MSQSIKTLSCRGKFLTLALISITNKNAMQLQLHFKADAARSHNDSNLITFEKKIS